jgi:uncharacterized membrane-anchored protein
MSLLTYSTIHLTSIGTVIEAARMHLGVQKIIIFAVTFALTVPVGVVIGIVITDDNALENGPTDAQNLALGILILFILIG